MPFAARAQSSLTRCLTAVTLLIASFASVLAAPREEGFIQIELDGQAIDIHYFRTPPADPSAPAVKLLYFHGMPTTNAIWIPVMEELFGLMNVDSYAISWPGFGRSDAPSPDFFDYTETGLNRVPFKVADAIGIEHFVPVVHDIGGPFFICPATEPENLARLDGMVVLDTAVNLRGLPMEPVPPIQRLGRLMAAQGVPRVTIFGDLADILQFGTRQDVFARFPDLVLQISSTNSEDDNRQAISRVIQELKDDPLAFGGVCGPEIPVLDVLSPLLVWSQSSLLRGLLSLRIVWPSAETVLVDEAQHFSMLDREAEIAVAISAYLQGL